MKNKKLSYALLVFVVLLWGAIGYKVSKTYWGGEEYIEGAALEDFDLSTIEIQTAKYQLKTAYQDPFLKGKGSRSSGNVQPVEKGKATKKVQPKPFLIQPKIAWPKVEFTGCISSKTSANMKGIITINQKEYLVKEGDTVENIDVVSMHKDSIQLKFKENLKTFRFKKT